jgi:hypothetical protein
VSVENAGTATWRDGVNLAYHWLDHLGNPIVWDGIRTPLPREVPPGGTLELEARVRAPLPPGRYRLALDLVDEGRLWFAELGNPALESDHEIAPRIERRLAARGGDPQALAAQEEPLVREEEAEAVAHLAAGVAPPSDWSRRVLDAHQEGFAAVGGAVAPAGGFLARRRLTEQLAPWAPGPGRVPGFAQPLLCPSVVRDVEADWAEPIHGLPALRPPPDEPWVHDGRIVVRLHPDRR